MDAANPDPFSEPPHPARSTLRSYLAGGLSGDERLRLVEHLRDCEGCRAALEDLRGRSHAHPAETPAMNPAAGAPPVLPSPPVGVPPAPPRSAAAEGLRLPAWLVAAVLLVILVETAALLRGVWDRIESPDARQPRAGAATAAVADAPPRIRVVFVGSASEQAIRALLRTVHGRIVDGPSPDGAYIVEIRPAPTPGGDTPLQILRNRIDLVKQVGAGPNVDAH